MNDKVKKIIQPYWVEEQQGVYIPLIDKVLLKDNVPAMSYAKFIEYAKTNRVEIATKDELLQMYLQKRTINKILEEHNGDIFNAWVGSSSEYGSDNMWFVNFGSGDCGGTNKSYSNVSRAIVSRAVVDLKSKTNNKTMEQFNLEEYLKNPNKKVVTRDGHKVRILCIDRKNEYPILALVDSNSREEIECYTIDGKCYRNTENDSDLFFNTKKCEGYLNLYKDGDRVVIGTVYPIESEKDAKMESKYIKDYVATCKIEWEE